eukprot:11183720-Ditylum_brightwellii.AAC.1
MQANLKYGTDAYTGPFKIAHINNNRTSLRRGIPDSLLTLNKKEIRDSFLFWDALIQLVKQYPPYLARCHRSGACHQQSG